MSCSWVFAVSLTFCVFFFSLSGFDEGNVSGMINSVRFRQQYGLSDKSKSAAQVAALEGNISSMVQIASVGGALIAFLLTDRIGRVWALRQMCLVWILGVALQITSNGNLGQLYAGRFVAGLGIGQSTVIGPTYLVEIAPRSIRGLCTCIFAGNVYLGIVLSYFANWGASMHISNLSNRQWIVPITLQIIFGGLTLVMSFLALESPRWLLVQGRHDEAKNNMVKLRGLPATHPYVMTELQDIRDSIDRERESSMGTSFLAPLRELFFIGSNLYRLILGLMVQFLGQWSGANSITIYAPQYFALLGVKGQNEKLYATCILGVVKLVSSLSCAFFIVDRFGRKRSLYTGLILQFLSILYIAVFLAVDGGSTTSGHQTAGQKRASTAGIAAIYVNGLAWALGWNTVQYLVNSEMFPLRTRALATSIIMCFHFANQYGNSKAVPTMLLPVSQGGMTSSGTMFFFAAVLVIGLVYVWFFLPETAGRSLESMDALFNLPWYQIGRKGKMMRSETTADLLDAKRDIELIETVDVEKVEHGRS
ncbi:hexose transporter protein [Sphaerosporella brunnea]|uniref:Hexose transporter protein n=1 Tax=Sphaerosporella brunnea TaxID=1250544 RepID=A0A5J5EK10_9PEZI|nr:hexose transporter protein [Sphaerosporella brunnea]